mmetsp:Transcript_76026/g.180923  ORF Transcript_76026/g.180923 Transcript_76026/m.180923 type:complete len:1205 (+) Transcript_76026:81-3695(+)
MPAPSSAPQTRPLAIKRETKDAPSRRPSMVPPGEQAQRMQAVAQATWKKAQRQQEDAAALEEDQQQQALEWSDRLENVTLKYASAKVDADTAIETAKAVTVGEIDPESFQQAEELLTETVKSVAAAQRFIAMQGLEASKAPPDIKQEIMQMGSRARSLQHSLKEEMARLKNAQKTQEREREEGEKRLEGEQKAEALELAQSKQLEEMLLPATEKVVSAEEQVDKVEMAAAPLAIDMAEDLKEVMLQAIKETELHVRSSQTEIGEARRFISAKNAQVQKFVASQRQAALEEFGNLQKRLNAVQERLNPFKNVRQDYESRMRHRKFIEELSSKLAGAEIEVEKATMMTAPLGGDSTEGIKETELTLSAAQATLSQTSRLITSKIKTAEADSSNESLIEELNQLKARAKETQEKLDDVRKTLKEAQVRAQADALLQEVSRKVAEVEDELQVMGDAELPFLKGDEKSLDMDVLLEEASKIAQKVQTALAEAQTFMARKYVEVARYADGPAKFVKEDMDALGKRLENGREQLQKFRASTADRQRGHLLAEVEAKVGAAEEDVSKLREATQAVKTMGKPGEAIADPFAEVVEAANEAERAAQASILVARKYLLQKTSELKRLNIAGAGSGSEIGKLQTRVVGLQQEVVKLKTATKDAEEKIRVKQLLVEVVSALQAAEGEVSRVASVAVTITVGNEPPSLDAVEKLDRQSSSAEGKLKATAKVVEVKLRSADGLLKEELVGMKKRIDVADSKLQEVLRSAKDQKEKALAANLVAQAAQRVSQAEAALQEALSAEAPFLKGIEGMSAAIWQSAISTCEEKAAIAQKAITDSRKWIGEQLAAAKASAAASADSSAKDLEPLRKRLDTAASKLAELKRDMAERRRRTQMQESSEKVKAVEAAVQKMATALATLPEDRLSLLPPEEASRVREEVADAQQEALDGCNDARKFVSQRLQEAKTFSEAQRGAMVAELSKLQSRLTHCQVELSKLQKMAEEREIRYDQKVKQKNEIEEARRKAAAKAQTQAGDAEEAAASVPAQQPAASSSSSAAPAAEPSTKTGRSSDFVKGKAIRDGQVGWVLLQDPESSSPLAGTHKDLYVCRSMIAMTDALNLQDCKVIRKVRPGEALERVAEGEGSVQPDAEMERLEFKAFQDGRKGFITLEGNKGTVYVEKHPEPLVVVNAKAELRAAPSDEASVLRLLDAGEALEPMGEAE